MVYLHRLFLATAFVCIFGMAIAREDATTADDSKQNSWNATSFNVSKLDRLSEAITQIAEKFQDLFQEVVRIGQKLKVEGKAALDHAYQRWLELRAKMEKWANEKKQTLEDHVFELHEKMEKWAHEKKQTLEDLVKEVNHTGHKWMEKAQQTFEESKQKLESWANTPTKNEDDRFGEGHLKMFVKNAFDYFGSKPSDAGSSNSESCSDGIIGRSRSKAEEANSDLNDGSALQHNTFIDARYSDVEKGFLAEVNRLVEILRAGVRMYEELGTISSGGDDLQSAKEQLHNNFMETILVALQSVNEFCGMEFRTEDIDNLLDVFKSAGVAKPTIVKALVSNTASALDNARVDSTQNEVVCKRDLKADGHSIDTCMSKVCSNSDKILRTFGGYMRSELRLQA